MRASAARRGAALFCATVLAAVAVGFAAVTPAAADALRVLTVDTSKFPVVRATVVLNGATVDPGAFTVREAGFYVDKATVVPTGRSDQPVGIALVVDTSASMAQNDKIAQARALANRLIAARGPNDQMAVVGFGAATTVLSDLTTDTAKLSTAVGQLVPVGRSPLYDGLRLGSGLFSAHPELLANVIVVSDGRDDGSSTDFATAQATALGAKVHVNAIALSGASDFEATSLKSLASATGGSYAETGDAAGIADIGAKVQAGLAQNYVITYTSTRTEKFDLAISAGSLVASAKVAPQQLAASDAPVREETPTKSLGPLRGARGSLLVAVLFFVALALAAVSLLELLVPDKGGLDTTLGSYTLDAPVIAADSDGSVVSTPFVKRAVAMTERLSANRGLLTGLESRLEQADLKLRAGEVALFTVVAGVLGGSAVAALINPVIGLAAGLIILGVPLLTLSSMAKLRRRRFTSQLPDTLNLLAAVLRSGYAIVQGIDAVAKEVGEPMGGELRRVIAEAQLGRDVTEALTDCAERMQSADFDWAVMAIGIQREVGGNLAELLSTVADTMVQRERLRREVKGLTAEGRMSAYVLGLLTPGLALFMYAVNKDYLDPLFDETLGQILLFGSVGLAVFGFWWMNRIIQIDV
jgi:tight adherence protein B